MAANKIDRINREIEKTREKITEYQNKLKGLEAQKTEAVQGLRAEYIRAKSFKEQIAAIAPAVEGVNNMALLRRALDGGELTLLEYLQESAFFIQAIREYIRLNHDYALSLASLNRYSTAK